MTSPAKAQVIANVVLFQLGWIACVLGAAKGLEWAGTVCAVLIVAWHVWRAVRPLEEINLVLRVVLIGAAFDTLMMQLGLIGYTSGVLVAGVAPHWILALWALFATSLNMSMNWLKGCMVWAAVLGAVSGPLSYWAAVRLGAATFEQPLAAVAVLALGWAVIMPLLMMLAKRNDGYTHRLEPAA
jgi:hypothetical protein